VPPLSHAAIYIIITLILSMLADILIVYSKELIKDSFMDITGVDYNSLYCLLPAEVLRKLTSLWLHMAFVSLAHTAGFRLVPYSFL